MLAGFNVTDQLPVVRISVEKVEIMHLPGSIKNGHQELSNTIGWRRSLTIYS